MKRAIHGIAVAGIALSVLGCSQTRGVEPLVNLQAEAPLAGSADYIGLIQNFTDAYANAKAVPGDGTLAKEFFISGANVVKVRCGLYFRSLGVSQQNLDFGAQELTLAGGLTALILGLVEAGTKPTAITAAAFAFGAASLDNYRQAYLFGPDVSSVHELVRRAMDVYVQAVQTKGVTRYSDAVALLSGLERLCEAHEIRRLVNESVEQAKPTTQDAKTAGAAEDPAPASPSAVTTGLSYSVGVSID